MIHVSCYLFCAQQYFFILIKINVTSILEEFKYIDKYRRRNYVYIAVHFNKSMYEMLTFQQQLVDFDIFELVETIFLQISSSLT